jgi:hypothetical protein
VASDRNPKLTLFPLGAVAFIARSIWHLVKCFAKEHTYDLSNQQTKKRRSRRKL